MILKPMSKIALWAALLIYAAVAGVSCASDSAESHESNESREAEEHAEMEEESEEEDEGDEASEMAAAGGEGGGFEMPQIGREHFNLAKWVGDWKCAQTISMPGQEAMEIEGKASFRSVFGGRFVEQHFSASIYGQHFEGRGVSGYNQQTKMYESTWMDNWGTAIMVSRGYTHSDGKSMTYHGSRHDEAGQKVETREFLTWKSDDEALFEMFDKAGGKEVKVMSIIYTRIK